MGETVQNIRLSAMGGAEASAAIDGVSRAMGGISQAHDALKNRFQEKFQHIGLMLFAGEALRAAGLGQETRQIIGLLNISIMALGSSLGSMAGPLMLVGAGFAALVGAIQKVQEKHKTLNDEITKTVAENDKELSSLHQSIVLYQNYVDVVGDASQEVKAVLAAKQMLANFDVSVEEKNLQIQIESTKALIVQKYEERQAILQTAAAEHNLTVERVLATVVLHGFTEAVREVLLVHHDYTKDLNDNAAGMLKLNVQWKEASQRLADLKKGILDSTAAMKDQIKAANDLGTSEVSHIKKVAEKVSELKQIGVDAFKAINTAQSQAFAKMIVEGKSFADLTAHIWRDLAEQVIAQIEAMIVKLMAFYLLKQMSGLGAFTGGGGDGIPIHAATGADLIVSRPTMFLAGEGGEPEHVQVTPFSRMGQSSGSGGGGSMVIQMENHFHGITDPGAIADAVGRAIVERIRGRGDINFGRS